MYAISFPNVTGTIITNQGFVVSLGIVFTDTCMPNCIGRRESALIASYPAPPPCILSLDTRLLPSDEEQEMTVEHSRVTMGGREATVEAEDSDEVPDTQNVTIHNYTIR